MTYFASKIVKVSPLPLHLLPVNGKTFHSVVTLPLQFWFTTNRRILCITADRLNKLKKKSAHQPNDQILQYLKENLLTSLNEKRWFESGFEINIDDIIGIELKEPRWMNGSLKTKLKMGNQFKLSITYSGKATFDILHNAMKKVLPQSLEIK